MAENIGSLRKRLAELRVEPTKPDEISESSTRIRPVEEFVTSIELRKKFAALENVSFLMHPFGPTTYDFLDNALLGTPSISLTRYPDSEIAKLGRTIIPMISKGFTSVGAASVFLLAYHLKRPGSYYGDSYVFEGAEALETMEDKDYSSFSQLPTIPNDHPDLTPTSNVSKEAAVYSFISASMLRLFTKSASNYVQSWNHILRGFSKFYNDCIDFYLPSPNEEAIQGLIDWISLEPKTKSSLYRLLYMGNADDRYSGMKKLLYDNHITHTGLHIVSMFDSLCRITGASPGLILSIIRERETQKQEVRCLVEVMKLMQNSDENHRRKMWCYGRLFNKSFMEDIRTKNCRKLVYIFASALKMLEPQSFEGIFNIVQFRNMAEAYKEGCVVAAKLLIQRIRAEKEKELQQR